MSYIDKIKKDGVIYDIHDSRGNSGQESLYRHVFGVRESVDGEAMFYTTVNYSEEPITTPRKLINSLSISPMVSISGYPGMNGFIGIDNQPNITILYDAETGEVTLTFNGQDSLGGWIVANFNIGSQSEVGFEVNYDSTEFTDNNLWKDTVSLVDDSVSFPEEFNFDW